MLFAYHDGGPSGTSRAKPAGGTEQVERSDAWSVRRGEGRPGGLALLFHARWTLGPKRGPSGTRFADTEPSAEAGGARDRREDKWMNGWAQVREQGLAKTEVVTMRGREAGDTEEGIWKLGTVNRGSGSEAVRRAATG